MPIGQETNYRDPVEPFTADDVDFDDPLERAAIALERLEYTLPPEVLSHFARSLQHELAYTWARLEPGQRQRHRKRAAAIIGAHAGETAL